MAAGFMAFGEHIYAIDMRTIRLCTYALGHASVAEIFEEKVPPGTKMDSDILATYTVALWWHNVSLWIERK